MARTFPPAVPIVAFMASAILTIGIAAGIRELAADPSPQRRPDHRAAGSGHHAARYDDGERSDDDDDADRADHIRAGSGRLDDTGCRAGDHGPVHRPRCPGRSNAAHPDTGRDTRSCRAGTGARTRCSGPRSGTSPGSGSPPPAPAPPVDDDDNNDDDDDDDDDDDGADDLDDE